MKDKNLVKITIEHDGTTLTFEKQAAFVVAFDSDGDSAETESVIIGYTNAQALGEVIAEAISEHDERGLDGLERAAMRSFSLKALKHLAKHLADEEKEPAEEAE